MSRRERSHLLGKPGAPEAASFEEGEAGHGVTEGAETLERSTAEGQGGKKTPRGPFPATAPTAATTYWKPRGERTMWGEFQGSARGCPGTSGSAGRGTAHGRAAGTRGGRQPGGNAPPTTQGGAGPRASSGRAVFRRRLPSAPAAAVRVGRCLQAHREPGALRPSSVTEGRQMAAFFRHLFGIPFRFCNGLSPDGRGVLGFAFP